MVSRIVIRIGRNTAGTERYHWFARGWKGRNRGRKVSTRGLLSRARGLRIIGARARETLENKYHCNSSDFFPFFPLHRPFHPFRSRAVSLLFCCRFVLRFIWHTIRDRQRPTRARPPRVDEKQIHFQPNYTRLSFTDLRHHCGYHFPRTLFPINSHRFSCFPRSFAFFPPFLRFILLPSFFRRF